MQDGRFTRTLAPERSRCAGGQTNLMKILLATDGSAAAQAALVAAARLLRRDHNEFHLLYIVPDFDTLASKPEECTRRAAAESKRTLHETWTVLRCEGIHADLFTRVGSPENVLTGIAEEYDVIVVGAQGQHQKPQPGLGHVASHVALRAPGVILIGRQIIMDRNFRILVGIDGSEGAQNALQTLACSFNLEESEVTLMHVIEMPRLHPRLRRRCCEKRGCHAAENGGDSFLQEQVASAVWHEAQRVLSAACAELRRHPFFVQTLVEEGRPGWQLVSQIEAGDYDLAVVGATGAGQLKGGMIGSVSVDVAWNAPCSVAVVR